LAVREAPARPARFWVVVPIGVEQRRRQDERADNGLREPSCVRHALGVSARRAASKEGVGAIPDGEPVVEGEHALEAEIVCASHTGRPPRPRGVLAQQELVEQVLGVESGRGGKVVLSVGEQVVRFPREEREGAVVDALCARG